MWGLGSTGSSPAPPLRAPCGQPSVLLCRVLEARPAPLSTRPCHPHSIVCVSPAPLFSPQRVPHCPIGGLGLEEPRHPGPGSQAGPGAGAFKASTSEQSSAQRGKPRLGKDRACSGRQARGLVCRPGDSRACTHPAQRHGPSLLLARQSPTLRDTILSVGECALL